MKITEIPVAVLRIQYQIARFPLRLIEQRVVSRFGEETPARLFYERSLGILDATAGGVLKDHDLMRRGVDSIERTDALSRAARLDAAAAVKTKKADAKFEATRDQAVNQRKNAQETKQEEVREARESAQERTRNAAEVARKRTDAVQKKADDVAARRVKTAEEAKRQQKSDVAAAEKKATAEAAAKRDDAQAKRAAAAKPRAQADRIEELADVAKDKRKAD